MPVKINDPNKENPKTRALTRTLFIVAIYLLFGLSWIFITDSINFSLFAETSSIALISSVKGSLFVILTAGLIFSLVYPALKKISLHQKALEKSNADLSSEKQKLLLSEKMLRESETLLRAIFDQATIGISVGYNETNIVSNDMNRPNVNPMFIKLSGRTVEELRGLSWADLTHPDDLKDDYIRFEKLKTGEIYESEKRLILPDGSPVWVHMIISPIYFGAQPRAIQLCVIEDISKRKELELSLNELVRSRAVLLDNLPGMAYRRGYHGERPLQLVSQGCFALTGYSQECLMSNSIAYSDLLLPEYRENLRAVWENALTAGARFKEEYEIMRADGDIRWVWEQGQSVYDEKGAVIALEGLIIDITKRKEQEFRLTYMSAHNEITGLHNRNHCVEFLSMTLKQHNKSLKALLLINLRKFNLLNLTHGYQYIEMLIKDIGVKLQTYCSDCCLLYHISNDRFAFFITDYAHQSDLVQLCERMTNDLEAVLTPNTIKCSIGIVEIDDYKTDPNSILKYASIAAEYEPAYQEKNYHFFNREMEESICRLETIKNELAECAAKETDCRLYLEYQPIVHSVTENIQGFEALARFESTAYGRISPLEFIPIAEETQLIVPIGKKIMRDALQFLKHLISKGFNDITMSVNISAIQLLRDDFLDDLTQLIDEIGVPPRNLNIEITESYFSDNYNEINDKLSKIGKLGISVALDDFGIGYSSLAREREMNVNCLKIDKYFIEKLLVLGPKETITSDIISMAHKLGHYVIAEGVEQEIQRQYLVEHGCEYMQGFFFSRPISPDAAIRLLSSKNTARS